MMRPLLVAVLLWVSPGLSVAAGLEGDQVSRWIEALVDVKTWGESHQQLFDVETDVGANPMTPGMRPLSDEELQSMRRPFSRATEAAVEAGLAGELDDVVDPHGFSLQSWGETGDQVFRAYMALQMAKQHADPAQMQAMISQLESNPQIPAAQRQNLLDSLRSVLRMMEVMSEASASDQAVVARHQKALEKAFD